MTLKNMYVSSGGMRYHFYMGEFSSDEVLHTLDPASFDACLGSIRSGNFQISQDDTPIEIYGKLGSGGGTKTVYDASLDAERFALALPNTTDGTETALAKWRVALHEPNVTDTMRDMGFVVNPTCEVMPVNISGTPFPAIRMTRFQDMPIQVRDGKNHSASVIESDIFAGSLELTSFMDRTADIRSDIIALIRSGVSIGRDSFNVCLIDGQLRLFFNDLASAKFGPVDSERREEYADFYSKFAIGAIKNGMSHDEFQHNKNFFDEHFGFQGSGYEEFLRPIMAELVPAT